MEKYKLLVITFQINVYSLKNIFDHLLVVHNEIMEVIEIMLVFDKQTVRVFVLEELMHLASNCFTLQEVNVVVETG